MTTVYSQWNNGEWSLEHFHPEVEWEMSSAAFDETGRSRGREALVRYWRRFWAAWRPPTWEIEELVPLPGGQLLAVGRLLLVGRASGIATEVPVFHLWTVENERVIRLLVFDDRETALQAVAS